MYHPNHYTFIQKIIEFAFVGRWVIDGLADFLLPMNYEKNHPGGHDI
jgi:hypothetical protein